MIFNLFVYHFHVNDFFKIEVLKNIKKMKIKETKSLARIVIIKEGMRD
jgi:hypothetical protein